MCPQRIQSCRSFAGERGSRRAVDKKGGPPLIGAPPAFLFAGFVSRNLPEQPGAAVARYKLGFNVSAASPRCRHDRPAHARKRDLRPSTYKPRGKPAESAFPGSCIYTAQQWGGEGQSVKFEAVVRIYRTENAVGSMGQFQKFLAHSMHTGRLH
jgi:hypothetical protein